MDEKGPKTENSQQSYNVSLVPINTFLKVVRNKYVQLFSQIFLFSTQKVSNFFFLFLFERKEQKKLLLQNKVIKK